MKKIQCHTLLGKKRGYFFRWVFAEAIKDEVGFKNEIMADCVVDDMHSFAKRRWNACLHCYLVDSAE